MRAIMRAIMIALASIPLWAGFSRSQSVEHPRPGIQFGGGVDYKNACSQIRDDRCCDSANFISVVYGTAEKRNGSQRYVPVSLSSQPVNSLYRAFVSTSGSQRRALFASTWNRVVFSTGEENPVWRVAVSSLVGHNQHFSFVTMNNKVIFSGDSLTDAIKQYDFVAASATDLLSFDYSTTAILIRAKYLLESRNYLLAANVLDVSPSTDALSPLTTYYSNRVYYTSLLAPSSFTVSRFMEIRPAGGEEITGMFELNGRVEISFPSSIYELSFTILNPTALGGDQAITPIVEGFGVLAPGTLALTGRYAIFLSKDGIVQWDGGRKNRLTLQEETAVISDAIEPVINRVIRAGTYKSAAGHYYPRRQWYVLSLEDPERSPRGRNNSVYVFDLVKREWYPMRNWEAESFESLDGFGESGDLVYGASGDGYVFLADKFGVANDARKEIAVETMDTTSTARGSWIGGTLDFSNVQEGSASRKLDTYAGTGNSSCTMTGVFNFTEWPDRSKIRGSDRIAFRVYVASHVQNISGLRVDLEVNDSAGSSFDQNFTSVTISSADLTAGGTAWNTIEIVISSFPILDAWVSLSSEAFPDAGAQTFFGVRFDLVTIGSASVSIDDLRVVQGTEQPLNAFRVSRAWNFGTNSDKNFRQIILDCDFPGDSSYVVDIFRNFGKNAKTISVAGDFRKELYVCGMNGTENITAVNPGDFSVLYQTATPNNSSPFSSPFAYRSAAADGDFLYALDRANGRLVKLDKSTISVVVSSAGSVGSGSTQFNNPWQVAVDDLNCYITDLGNHRVKVHRKSTLGFVTSFGSLGTGTSNFHLPTGVAVDDENLYIGDDGNRRIVKLSKSTGGYLSESQLSINTFGNLTLACDEEYLYCFYETIASTNADFLDVILEKKLKSDLSTVTKKVIRPTAQVSLSSSNVMGDPALLGDYIFLSFTDNFNGNGSYYIQKLLKTDLSVVRERISALAQYGLAGNGLSFLPSRRVVSKDTGVGDSNFAQVRVRESGLDNPVRLHALSFNLIGKPLEEKEKEHD